MAATPVPETADTHVGEQDAVRRANEAEQRVQYLEGVLNAIVSQTAPDAPAGTAAMIQNMLRRPGTFQLEALCSPGPQQMQAQPVDLAVANAAALAKAAPNPSAAPDAKADPALAVYTAADANKAMANSAASVPAVNTAADANQATAAAPAVPMPAEAAPAPTVPKPAEAAPAPAVSMPSEAAPAPAVPMQANAAPAGNVANAAAPVHAEAATPNNTALAAQAKQKLAAGATQGDLSPEELGAMAEEVRLAREAHSRYMRYFRSIRY